MILTMYEAIVVPPKTLHVQSTVKVRSAEERLDKCGVRLCPVSTVLSVSQGKSITKPKARPGGWRREAAATL